MSFLKSYLKNLDIERIPEKQAPPVVMKQFDQEIQKILDH